MSTPKGSTPIRTVHHNPHPGNSDEGIKNLLGQFKQTEEANAAAHTLVKMKSATDPSATGQSTTGQSTTGQSTTGQSTTGQSGMGSNGGRSKYSRKRSKYSRKRSKSRGRKSRKRRRS
jgi:hypothetical protein